MAKITPMLGLLSNMEVLQILHDRGADGQQHGGRAVPSERLAYQYLSDHSPGLLDRSDFQNCIELFKPFNLSRAEVLNLLNICPSSPVEVHLVIDNCEERLDNDQVEKILELVAVHLRH